HLPVAGPRDVFRQIMEKERVLHPDPYLAPDQQAAWYDVLLELACPAPLTYADYQWIESCTGTSPGRPLPGPLGRAVAAIQAQGLLLKLAPLLPAESPPEGGVPA